MQKDYRYSMNKSSKRITIIISIISVAVIIFLSLYSTSGYLPAWLATFALTVLALYVLSIPRFVRIDDDSVEIHCLVELTKIAVEDIKTIKKIGPKEMKYCIPLLGSYGFFGYYGYYYNFAEMTIFKIYASKWEHFVRVEDIYEDTYIVNCDNADELIYFANKAKQLKKVQQGDL